ncbi:preprotein translocase subunit SecE [Actinomyces sp. B33]|uniref:preprotein translocase subunit SecE n=1 Tax=Actinomyces sp. B33 TaxID=2942131 RepID=UPI00234052EF|nr:preprotein translocase subunit SecE [Actinomyces sp. B33]MDC4233583.1 preprotein translocase subunit SecE [Actinomyces sp. B33]
MSDINAVSGDSIPKDRTKYGATPSRNQAGSAGQEKPNILRRIWLFISQVVEEMKKVVYPTPNETWTYFTVVIVFVVAIMAFTGLLDFGFGKLSALIFG